MCHSMLTLPLELKLQPQNFDVQHVKIPLHSMTIISSNVLTPNPITFVQPTYAYIYTLGRCTHSF